MRFTKFLMQVFVCLLASTAALSQESSKTASDSSISVENTSATSLSVSDPHPKNWLSQRKCCGRKARLIPQRFHLAAFDSRTNRMERCSRIDKECFSDQGGDYRLLSQLGENLRVRIVRPNGVNTAVMVSDAATGNTLFPLMVRYPIEKDRRGAAGILCFRSSRADVTGIGCFR
jgi:hypothetical protein